MPLYDLTRVNSNSKQCSSTSWTVKRNWRTKEHSSRIVRYGAVSTHCPSSFKTLGLSTSLQTYSCIFYKCKTDCVAWLCTWQHVHCHGLQSDVNLSVGLTCLVNLMLHTQILFTVAEVSQSMAQLHATVYQLNCVHRTCHWMFLMKCLNTFLFTDSKLTINLFACCIVYLC